ncbi:MAG: bacillithiol biosynthesis cysteine-adding enzyme BshC [Candidatus Zixiibacteriota bacterium]
MNHLIAPNKALGYSKLYLDFLADLPSARRLYGSGDLPAVAQQLDRHAAHRPSMVHILRCQNTAFGASERTLAAIEQLLDPKALCVFAGQQAGLFGGPMMTLIKALGAVNRARQFSQELGRPVVPIFWIAADDHDFAEANHTWLLNRESELVRVSYDTPPASALSMGKTRFSDQEALDRAISAYRASLGETEFTLWLYDLLDRSYTSGETFVSAFGRFMAALTTDTGLILFDPSDPEVKRLAAPFFGSMLDRQVAITDAIHGANQLLRESGYHVQVEKDQQATHLFLDQNARTPVTRDSGQFRAGDRSYDEHELRSIIDSEPERLSPDALLRPVMQSYLLPVVGQLGGPSEIAYFAQMSSLFPLFDLPAPVRLARPTLTLVESRYEKMMDEFGITFDELTGDIELVVNRVLTASFPADLEQRYSQLRADVASRFEEFSSQSLQFDPSVSEFAKQTFGKIDFSLRQFEDKLFAGHKKKQKEMRDRLYRLGRSLYPNRGLQERTLNVAYFVAKHGREIVSFVHQRMDANQTAHQLISLAEFKK